MTEVEVSLFPIPGSVSLPFSVVPLHVFEPRYRKMILDSISLGRRIGVAHTKRLIAESKNPAFASEAEILNSNQETYEAHPIFSAGFAEIIETLPDGRMVVQIKMDYRYEVIEERQQIPYKVVLCRLYLDVDDPEPSADQLRKELDLILAPIQSESWTRLSTLEYSFSIYSLILLDPEVLQDVLELRSCADRIRFLKDALEGHPQF